MTVLSLRAFSAAVSVISIFFAVGTMRDAVAASEITISKVHFASGGKRIQMDRSQPDASKNKSAILVLHGAGGILFDGPEMRRVARRLTEDGHTTYLVHYFERTGTFFGLDSNMHKNFETWLGTIRDAIVAVQRDQGNANPVGIYGYSLGGFLAVAAASDNPRVGAVAEHAGGIWDGKSERIGRMPPVMVFHGKRDQRVPYPKYALPLVAVLRDRGAKVETNFFVNEGHVFSAAAMSKVREDAARFFRRPLPSKG